MKSQRPTEMIMFELLFFILGWMDGCMDDLRFYVLFNSISVISGQWMGDNERQCAVGLRSRSERFPLQAGLETGTA